MRRHKGQFVKGDKRIKPGRPKGSKNQFTTLKEAFVEAFKEVGGQDYLIKFARGDSKCKQAFVKSIASMLPRDVQLSGAQGTPLIPPTIIFKDSEEEPKEITQEETKTEEVIQSLPVVNEVTPIITETKLTEG